MKTVTLHLLLISLALGFGLGMGLGCGGDTSVEPRPPEDFPPRAVETFGAQTLTAEQERLMINFATAFEDPEGRPLSYSAESSDVSVLTVAMAGIGPDDHTVGRRKRHGVRQGLGPRREQRHDYHSRNGERSGTSR